MPTMTDFDLLKIIYEQIGELKDSHHSSIGAVRTEIRDFIVESRYHRKNILDRLDKLEARRMIDWSGLLKGGWAQIVIFLLLIAGNVQLLDAAKLAFKR